jgi:uncharacterized protein YdeI (YjbR/CyaY-like superfamily)
MNRIENMNPSAIEIPEDLLWAPDADAHAKALVETICTTHRQEYIHWIEQARQPMTRARRLQDALRMMTEGKRLLI